MTDLNQIWHKDKRFNSLIMKYHDNHARQPQSKDAKQRLEIILKNLTNDLSKENLCTEFIYSGSTYENVKIGKKIYDSDDLEFDIMIIVGKDLVQITNDTNNRYHPKLEPTAKLPSILQSCITANGLLDPSKIISKFTGIIQSYLERLRNHLPDNNFKIRAHGTAIQLDVINQQNNRLYFSIDLVPTFIIRNHEAEYYIPKPDAYANINWRRSFSIEERSIFDRVDPPNGCCKKFLRVIKHIFIQEATLRSLSSYHLKTVMMNLIEDYTRFHDHDIWKEDQMFIRFIDYLKCFYCYLSHQTIPHRFTQENILKLNPSTVNDLKCRIAELLRSQHKTENLFVSVRIEGGSSSIIAESNVYEGNDLHDF